MPSRLLLLIILCQLLLPVHGSAQVQEPYRITIDSLPMEVAERIWRFMPNDLGNGADPALDDSQWKLVQSPLYMPANGKNVTGFNGIGWLRYHFELDSEAASHTLALRIKQRGASEIYVDGKFVHRYGKLLPRDSARYVNPQTMPLALPSLSPGQHVLAVRYANWNYQLNKEQYNHPNPGFTLTLWKAHKAIEHHAMQLSVLLFAFVLLFGIFVTLCLIHFILFLYYRAEKANAYFSLFAACTATVLLVPAIMRVSRDASFILKLSYFEVFVVAAVGASLSLLLNDLFSKQKWHLYLTLGVCAALVLLNIFWIDVAPVGIIAILVAVPLEALYILAVALWKRQPGARIIGGGLIILIVMFLTMTMLAFFYGNIDLNDSTPTGRLLVATLLIGVLSIPVSMSMHLAWRFSRVNRDLKTQLKQVETLNERTREQETEKQRLLETRKEELEKEVAERTASLRAEKQKSDDLLLNILPAEIAEELKENGRSEAKLYSDVTVLFTDFVDFTQLAEKLSPSVLVAEIDRCFQAFDGIIERHGLEKIKTIGDAYLAVSGLPAENPRHAQAVISAALEIREYMAMLKETNPASFEIRFGVHSGAVVAGIVGIKKFAYDIWGDTVNTAARMEQHSEPGCINISNATYELVKEEFLCTYRGELEAKHKGKMGMYFVVGSKELAMA
jgi:adenylate cyclase